MKEKATGFSVSLLVLLAVSLPVCSRCYQITASTAAALCNIILTGS
jgi:hypothetical protein